MGRIKSPAKAPRLGNLKNKSLGKLNKPKAPDPSTTIWQDHEYEGSNWFDTYLSYDYEDNPTGSIDLTKIHPPAPDTTLYDAPMKESQSAVLGAMGDPGQATIDLGKYWAGEIGANWGDEYELQDDNTEKIISHSPEETNTKFRDEFKPVFESDIDAWQLDWGQDTSWEGGTADPDSWKTHGSRRRPKVDDSYMIKAENKFISLADTIGYNSTDDLVGDVYPGYGNEINVDKLQDKSDNPEQVIGSPNDKTGKLEGGSLVRSQDASGAWGEYLLKERQAEATADQDKEDAKEDLKLEFDSIKEQRKGLSRAAAPGLRESKGEKTLTGFRRGGRRAGGYTRGEIESLQVQAKQLGGLRQKARLAYDKKIDRVALIEKQTIEGAAVTLKGKVENEFTDLASDLKLAENKYQSDSLDLDATRSENIFDTLGIYEREDTGWPWPRDPDKDIDE